jgi:hypothetical protein
MPELRARKMPPEGGIGLSGDSAIPRGGKV